MKTLLVTNIKGGVSKTTTAVSIAAGLKLYKPESSVLLIDGDPQGSVKSWLGLKLQNADKDFASFLIEDTPFEDAIQKIPVGNGFLDVMISSRKLSEADVRMSAFPRREETLKLRLKKQNVQYDYCVIDSSPAMNLVLLNFMTLADAWLIPATMDAFAISNINYLFEQKKIIEEFYDRTPNILGILPTMFDRRTTVSQLAYEAVKTRFSSQCRIFEPIGVDSTVRKAQVKKQIIYEFAESRAAEAYSKLTHQLLEIL